MGDDGIYLMSSGFPPIQDPARPGSNLVAYAREADPTAMDADACFEAKRAIYGGDDGSDLLRLEDIRLWLERAGDSAWAMLDITAEAIAFAEPVQAGA